MAAVPSIGRASLVEAPARSAQAAATEGLYARHSAKILGYCMHQLGSREEAEDAVQTTFMNAFRALGRGVVPESESAWLFKIAENVCLSRRRSSWRRGRIESPSDFDVIEEIIPGPSRQRDELIGIEDALASMPDQQRRAILLREWQGLSYREISEELEVSQSAVETLIFRARRSLAHGLEQPEQQRKPKRKGLRRSLHIIDIGTLLAAAKTLLAGSAAAQATAAAVAVTAVAGTAATVKIEGHSPKPAATPPAAIGPAPKAAAPRAETAVRVSAPVQASPDTIRTSPTSVVPRSRPAVITPTRKPVQTKAAASKPVASAPASVVPATTPTVSVAPPAQPTAPVAPVPAPIAHPEPSHPPVVVAPPTPVDHAQPDARTSERTSRAERRQERQERRNRGRQAPAEPQPIPAPSSIVAVIAPVPPAPDVMPAEPEQSPGERRRGRRWQQREVASLPVVDPAVAEQSAEDAVVADPAVAPEAEQAGEREWRGWGRSRRP